MGNPDWNVLMVDIHLWKLLWVYCLGHAGVNGNDQVDRLAGKATLISGLLLGRSEVLRSLRHYLWAQSQGHHTTDHLEKRGTERGNPRRSSLKGWERAIVNQMNIGTISNATLGKLLRRGGAHMGILECIDTILNRTEMKTFIQACSQTPKQIDDWIPLADTKRAGDLCLQTGHKKLKQNVWKLACTKKTYTFVEKQNWQQQNASCRTAKITSGWGRTAGKATTLLTL